MTEIKKGKTRPMPNSLIGGKQLGQALLPSSFEYSSFIEVEVILIDKTQDGEPPLTIFTFDLHLLSVFFSFDRSCDDVFQSGVESLQTCCFDDSEFAVGVCALCSLVREVALGTNGFGHGYNKLKELCRWVE